MPQNPELVSPPGARYFIWVGGGARRSLADYYHIVALPEGIVKYHCWFRDPSVAGQYSMTTSINACLPGGDRTSSDWQEVTFQGFLLTMRTHSGTPGISREIRREFIRGGAILPERASSRLPGLPYPFLPEEPPPPPPPPPPKTYHKIGVPKGKLP